PSPQHPKVDQAKYIQVIERFGDIFAAPPCSVVIHACNCEGHWGAGIAKAFKDHYPQAYSLYHHHCIQAKQSDLRGTAFLIPPQNSSHDQDEVTVNHFIGCLFTSRGKGRTKDSPTKILVNTRPAFEHLLRQAAEWNAKENDEVKAGELWMCQINSGLFKVPWEKTRCVLEQIEVEE
ncbi:ADP-ribose 1''-phosphate phosphatase, partial [Delphinella strobiligena]